MHDGKIAESHNGNRLINEIHTILLDGVRGEHGTPGELRTTQNWIGSPGSTIETAAFVPPPPDEVSETMAELDRFIHDRTLPDLVAITLMHYQFETIHPFVDGNGRVGRLMIPLMMIERQILDRPVPYLSAYFDRHRSRYYELLDETRHTGNPFPWLDFFLDGVASSPGTRRSDRFTWSISNRAFAASFLKSVRPRPRSGLRNCSSIDLMSRHHS